MPEVPIRRTVIGAAEARALFDRAWSKRFRQSAPVDVMALLLGLWDLETAAGNSQFHFNFGNIVATRPDSQSFYLADDTGNLRKFRAYDSKEAGADDFVNQLTRDSRKEWRDGLLTGDPEEFVRALNGQRGGLSYFEADFNRYLRTFLQRWRKYDPKAEPPQRGQIPNQSPTGPRLLSLLLLGAIVTCPLWGAKLLGKRS